MTDARPLVRAGRRPPRRGLPAVLVHEGHRRTRSRSSSTRSACARASGCSTSAAGPGRHAHALGRRGIEVVGVDISQRFVDLARGGRARRASTFERLDARHLDVRRRVRRRHLAVPGRVRPGRRRARAPRRRRRSSTPTAWCSTGMARAVRPGGRRRGLGLLGVLPGAVPRGARHASTRHAGCQPRAHDGAIRGRRRARRATCGPPASRPASCGCSPTSAGLVVDHLWSVTPAATRPTPPDLDHPEFLLVARRP